MCVIFRLMSSPLNHILVVCLMFDCLLLFFNPTQPNTVTGVQTDHKSIMRQIESAMFAVHAEAKAAKLAANPNAQTSVAIVHKTTKTNEDEKKKEDAATIEAQIRSDAAKAEERAAAARAAESAAAPPAVAVRPLDPFYRVASVAQDSPAEVAGLKPNDLVLQFGSVSKSNYSPATMASVVSSSIGRAIPVLVDRDGKRKELRLIPQAWGGRGMLGCHLVDI